MQGQLWDPDLEDDPALKVVSDQPDFEGWNF